MSDLKPCPLCNANATAIIGCPSGNVDEYKVECEDCECSTGWREIFDDAVGYWNTRPIDAAADAEIARLRACIAEVKADADLTLNLPSASEHDHGIDVQAADTLAIIAKHGVENV